LKGIWSSRPSLPPLYLSPQCCTPLGFLFFSGHFFFHVSGTFLSFCSLCLAMCLKGVLFLLVVDGASFLSCHPLDFSPERFLFSFSRRDRFSPGVSPPSHFKSRLTPVSPFFPPSGVWTFPPPPRSFQPPTIRSFLRLHLLSWPDTFRQCFSVRRRTFLVD